MSEEIEEEFFEEAEEIVEEVIEIAEAAPAQPEPAPALSKPATLLDDPYEFEACTISIQIAMLCGNKKSVGQVLIGRHIQKDEQPLALGGYCSWLPLPSIQHPDLVADDRLDEALVSTDESRLSCAELAMKGSQSLSINTRMAATASEMLGKTLLTNDLETYAVYIDEAAGQTRKFITEENIGRWLGIIGAMGEKRPETQQLS